MLYMPMGENKPIRVQGAFLTDEEVERIVDFVKNQQEVEYDEAMMPSEIQHLLVEVNQKTNYSTKLSNY